MNEGIADGRQQNSQRNDAVRLATIDDMEVPGSAVKFRFIRQGRYCDGFVVRIGMEIRAYENRCPHQPLSLDYGDGRFFTDDGCFLNCQNHGALFEPLSGLCIHGPCLGSHLAQLTVEIREGAVWLASA